MRHGDGKASFELFDKYTDRYDSWYARHRVTAENEALCLAELRLQGLGVDLGAGSGFFTRVVGAIALEPSRRMLHKARERFVVSVRAVAEAIPVRDCVLDYVLMVATLCFLDDPAEAFNEARRVLKDNGLLVLCIIPRDSKWGLFYKSKRDENPFYKIARFYTVEETIHMLKCSGFRIESYKATLTYGPLDKARVEQPTTNPSGKGFVCILSRKFS